jgi:hypothetical protein
VDLLSLNSRVKSSLKLTISNFPEDLATNDQVNITAHLVGVEIEIDRDPKLNRSSIPATHTRKQFQET